MKDFLGRDISPGDHVVWATMSGRSVSMTYGIFEGFTETGRARLTPLDGSRWKRGGETGWVDSRNGKTVYLNSKTHQKEPEYHIRQDGVKLTYDEYLEYVYGSREVAINSHDLQSQRRKEFTGKRIPAVMKDYVVRADKPSTVTLDITENIVKVEAVDAS